MLNEPPNVLLVLSVVLVAGSAFGTLAKMFRLPSVTGQILVGILIGPSVLHVFEHKDIQGLSPMIDFALGLMAVVVGSHLQFARMKVAWRRLAWLVGLEIAITPMLVFAIVSFLPDTSWQMAVLLSAIAVSTAPATIIAMIKEAKAKGMFVQTLIMATALNNLACISLFELAHAASLASLDLSTEATISDIALAPLKQIFCSILLGGGVGLLLILATRRVLRPDRLAAMSLMAILFVAGLGEYLDVSVLLSSLILGITLSNLTPDKDEIGHAAFANFEYAIFAVFFTVAGTELNFDYIVPAGLLAAGVFVGRAGGKLAAGHFAMRIAGSTQRVRTWLGPALLPQAGLAVGLMLIVTEDPRFGAMSELFLAVVVTVVLVNEIIGPIMTRVALQKSGEAGNDRERALDFLHEENITTELKGDTLEEVVQQLVDLAIKSNRLDKDSGELFQAVMESSRGAATGVGQGLAIPHARVDGATRMAGAMGIHREGLRWNSPDGRLVHCVVLILTPKSMPERHLEVLGALAQAVGSNRTLRQELYHVDTPAHAYELLHLDEEAEDFNRFLDEEM